jgi:hypothetical protein
MVLIKNKEPRFFPQQSQNTYLNLNKIINMDLANELIMQWLNYEPNPNFPHENHKKHVLDVQDDRHGGGSTNHKLIKPSI